VWWEVTDDFFGCACVCVSVVACCSVLQCTAIYCMGGTCEKDLWDMFGFVGLWECVCVVVCVALCCTVLQCVAVCCSVLRYVALRRPVKKTSRTSLGVCECVSV